MYVKNNNIGNNGKSAKRTNQKSLRKAKIDPSRKGLARVVGSIEMPVAEEPKAPVQRLADKVAAIFVPVEVSIALLTVTGAATVAAALHRAYAIGWIGATVAAAALLSLPIGLETRTVVALLCGPLVGITVHLAALSRADG